MNRKLRIGIIGTRGIPNEYGGFEQFAEIFGKLMSERGHEITVYCSSAHSFREKSYHNIQLIHCYDLEPSLGTAGQFVYDLNCILDSRKRNFDIILQLGYTSSSVWTWLFPRTALLVTNMDGLEWKRTKYSNPVQWFLRHAEGWAAKYSDHLIADSEAIAAYLHKVYRKPSAYLPYGAKLFHPQPQDVKQLTTLELEARQYDLMVARFEPENHVATILDSYATCGKKLVAVGDHTRTGFGRKLFSIFRHHKNILFTGGIFNMQLLNILRYHSRLYLHGHSVGGTNPSLLEAMAANALIAAHGNDFNKSVLKEHAFYFQDEQQLMSIISQTIDKANYRSWLDANTKAIKETYNWETIVAEYERLFYEWLSAK